MKRAITVGLPGLLAAGLILAAGQSAWADGFLAAGPIGAPAGAASPSFDAVAVGDSALATQRAGDNITNTDSFKNTINAATTQTQEANITGNTSTGNAGDIKFDKDALGATKGIGQVVANSAPLGAAQGAIIMNIYLNPGAGAP